MTSGKSLFLAVALASLTNLPASAATWDLLIVEGEAHYQRGNLSEALKSLEVALKEVEKPPVNKVNLARTLNDLGVVEDELGHYDKSVSMYQKVLALIQDKPDSAEYATTLNNLANVFKDQGKYDQAEPLYKQVIGIYEKTTEADSQFIAMSNHNLASLYAQMGKFKEAEDHYKLALSAGEKALGPENDHVVDIVSKLARVEDKLGNRDVAKPLFNRYLKNVMKMLGLKNDDPDKIAKLKTIVADLKKSGQTGNAELIEKALSYE